MTTTARMLADVNQGIFQLIPKKIFSYLSKS